MALTPVLGPLVSSWSIERAARDLLVADRNLIGLYLDEVVRQTDESVRSERPRTVAVRERAKRFSDEQLPALIIVCPGTIEMPDRDGDGLYTATWQMTVAAVTQASDSDVGRQLASDLCVAACGVLVQMLPRVDARVLSTRWSGEASDDVPMRTDQRSRCVVGRGILVTVGDVLCDLTGVPPSWDEPDPPLDEPPVDPGTPATVDTVSVTVTPVEEIT